MFLTEEQACILLHDRSTIPTKDIKLSVNQFNQYATGQFHILLDTGAKLYYDTKPQAFYISGYRHDECDTISLFDHLDLFDDYFYELRNRGFSWKAIEARKKVYHYYKLNRLKQVA